MSDCKSNNPFSSSLYRLHNIELDRLIREGHAENAVEYYIQHPNQSFANAFVNLTEEIDGYGIDRVYINFKRVLVRFIQDGEIYNGLHLHRFGMVVLKTLCRHHEIISWHRDNPLLPLPDNITETDLTVRQPLFAPDIDVADVAKVTDDPSNAVLKNELFASILREAREVGLFHVRAVQIYERYSFEKGTTHGAYVHLARYAIVECGKVVGFRPWRTAVDTAERPSPRVIGQVRKIHLQAAARVRETAIPLGIILPRGV